VAEELGGNSSLAFERTRVHAILAGLEAIVAGDYSRKLPLSAKEDELDAIAHAVNVLADELRLAREHRTPD
jgi:HAMP domain-containing protein